MKPGVGNEQDLLARVIGHGDSVAVDNGRLAVTRSDGSAVLGSNLRDYREHLIETIIQITGLYGYRFTYHTTGVTKEYSSDRLTLFFECMTTGEVVEVHYNVDVKRARSTAKGSRGSLLPKGRFTPKEHSRFVQFWDSTGLDRPRSLSEFTDILGRLKSLVFTGQIEQSAGRLRFTSKIIPLLSISSDCIAESVILREKLGNSSVILREKLGKNVREGISPNLLNTAHTEDSSCVSKLLRLKNSEQGIKIKAYPYIPPDLHAEFYDSYDPEGIYLN